MLCGIQKRITELTLLLYLSSNEAVNIKRLLHFFLEQKMVNNNILLLSEPQYTARCLVHKSRSPPRRIEDDAVHELEIESRARRVNLCQENHVARAHKAAEVLHNIKWEYTKRWVLGNLIDEATICLVSGGLQLLECSLPLRHTHTAVIHKYFLYTALGLETLLDEFHLIVEVTEDDEALWIRLLLQNLYNLFCLGAVANPVRARVVLALLTPLGVDVGLRMDTNLAEAKEECHKAAEVEAVRCEKMLEFIGEDALDAAIELGFCVGREVEFVRLHNWVPRKDGRKLLANLLCATAESVGPHLPLCILEGGMCVRWLKKFHKRSEVTETIYDGRAREEPLALTLDSLGELPLSTIFIAESMRLIKDDTMKAL